MAVAYTIARRERVGSRKCHTVDITIDNAETVPVTVAASSVSLQRLDDVVVEQCMKSDGARGYHMQWDPTNKQLHFFGADGTALDLAKDTSTNFAIVARAKFVGV